jgi:hypothetical protein
MSGQSSKHQPASRLARQAAPAVITLCAGLLVACGNDDPVASINPNEVVTTVTLSFTATGAESDVVATWDDPDGDGGDAPMIDPIVLQAGATYRLAIEILNKLATPTQDVTPEIWDERDEHQVFLLGSAVKGPATSNEAGAVIEHAYDDQDSNGWPVGLTHVIDALEAGTGQLRAQLRHMPKFNNEVVKTGDLADQVRASDAADPLVDLPGSPDFDVTFEVEVQ